MTTRLDTPASSVFHDHLRPAARRAARPAPVPRAAPRVAPGGAYDWLFAKGGMSVVILAGLMLAPLLALVPTPRATAGATSGGARPGATAMDSQPGRTRPMVAASGAYDPR
jgi:hypothetical protein